MFFVQFFFFFFLYWMFVKEFFLLKFISLYKRKFLEGLLIVYFLFIFLYLKKISFSILFFLIPLFFFFLFFIFLNKKEEDKLLAQLYSLLISLDSQMKLGLSFMTAWQNGVEDIPQGEVRNKIQKITEILKFQKNFSFDNKKIEHFIKDLSLIYQSSSPLKRLRQLQRKIKVEQSFQIKSERTLLQTRIQACLLSFFYFGLLAWTIISYGNRYAYLILTSLLFFSIGFFWIIKIGRKMKWSI